MIYSLTESQVRIYQRYANLNLPRHTSYPTVPVWSSGFQAADHGRQLAALEGDISLYVHVPFCERLCYYCGCNKMVMPRENAASSEVWEDKLLHGISRELQWIKSFRKDLKIRQLHLGGGTPTYLQPKNLDRLLNLLRESFAMQDNAESACEIDPRVTTSSHLKVLRDHGFQRLSLGIQDFDPKVQAAVNRVQDFSLVQNFMNQCREQGFASINFDLIYGLPYQDLISMRQTLDAVLELKPDRIAFFRLAMVPDIFRWQRLFSKADMPDGELPLQLYLMAINAFQDAGYEFIGLDHFARSEEALQTAREDGSLRRNFQGMTTGGDLPVIGIGPSAISTFPYAYAQNAGSFTAWIRALESGLATEKGMTLNSDDQIRRDLLQTLYCQRIIDPKALEKRHAIDFTAYFGREQDALSDFVQQGLLEKAGDVYRLTAPLGEILARVVAAAFDAYIPSDAYKAGMKQGSRVG